MFRVAALCILLVLSVPASAQPPQNSDLRPLPAQERFTADTTISAEMPCNSSTSCQIRRVNSTARAPRSAGRPWTGGQISCADEKRRAKTSCR